MKRLLSLFVFALVALCLAWPGAAVQAAPLQPDEVPEPLRPWVSWVLRDDPQVSCPYLQGSGGSRRCQWPSRLTLTIDADGGRFEQSWKLHTRGWVPLPGDDRRWPQDVTVGERPTVVVPQGGRPGLELAAGTHVVRGVFRWDSLPEKLEIPPETGLLALTLSGEAVAYPQRDVSGALWLNRKGEEGAEEDLLDLVVNRRIHDDIPLVVTTRIDLHVSGKNREELLAKTVLDGFTPMSVVSDLPARIEPDGRLRVQVRPGRYSISIDARHDGPIAELTLPEAQGPWASEEIWAYQAAPELHEVDVAGVPPIDPQQTLLPDEWKVFPAYRLIPGDKLKLIERRRGEVDRGDDRLSLQREWWLDFDGRSLTVRDQISGQVHNSWRLDKGPSSTATLGRVTLGGRDQLITYRDGEAYLSGVELRQRNLDMTADMRVAGDDGTGKVVMSAVDWDHDFHEVSGVLHLPPGWRLLHAEGVDEVNDTWIQQWTLLDIFLVLVISIAIGRLFGIPFGVLSLVTLALCFPEWTGGYALLIVMLLGLLVIEALLRAIPEGRARALFVVGRWIAVVLVAVIVLMFSVQQIRGGLYPALERHDSYGDGGFMLAGAAAPQMVAKDDRAAEAPPMPPMEEMNNEDISTANAPELPMAGEMEKEGGANRWGEQTDGGGGDFKQEPYGSVDKLISTSGKRGGSYGEFRRQKLARQRQQLREYDANTVVQTGPGVPSWSWRSVRLAWSGPVERSQQVMLYLLAPELNLALAWIRVLFLIVLSLAVFGIFHGRRRFGADAGAAALALVIGGAAFLSSGTARAESYPSSEMLSQLRQRLVEPPSCLPDCAQSPRLRIQVINETMRLYMDVHTATHVAVPLPGGADQWLPSIVNVETTVAPVDPATVTVTAQPAPVNGARVDGLSRDDAGTLWVELPPGRHKILIEGPLPAREAVQINMPLKPHQISAETEGWTLEGIHEDGLADDHLQLTRIHKDGEAPDTLEMGPLPPFVRVERTMMLGLSWEITTRVVRVTPTGAPVKLAVPLMSGESVTTESMRVEEGKVLVNLAADAVEAEWDSVLEVGPEIALKAAGAQPWIEVWRLEVGPLWHVEATGIPTVNQGPEGMREWRPWPDEEVNLTVTRPQGVPGQDRTIDAVNLSLRPGVRATDATLRLTIRSSRGGHHVVTLPPEARLQAVRVDGVEKAIGQEEQSVRLPLVPGAQTIELDWREPVELGPHYRAPEVIVGKKAVNVTVDIEFPRDRWILWVRGPTLGPAVLFWSSVLVLILAALLLGRIGDTPMRSHRWFLLGLGMIPLSIWAAMFVVLWFLALRWRRRHGDARPWVFNLVQLALVGLTVIAAGCLAGAIYQGLLGTPDMQIEGN
ncbi:MAG: hypothetical protein KC636_12030, partial [Myxococcales bacterium]|nr:hypothetical protein [Myxococcales bacterium]